MFLDYITLRSLLHSPSPRHFHCLLYYLLMWDLMLSSVGTFSETEQVGLGHRRGWYCYRLSCFEPPQQFHVVEALHSEHGEGFQGKMGRNQIVATLCVMFPKVPRKFHLRKSHIMCSYSFLCPPYLLNRVVEHSLGRLHQWPYSS